MRRYHLYWQIFYTACFFDHIRILLWFLDYRVYPMVYVNVFSVVIFFGCVVAVVTGRYRLAFWGAIFELVTHGISATLCVGLQLGFINYSYLVLILLFVQPFYSWKTATVLALLTLASAAAVTAYSLDNPPAYSIPIDAVQSMIISQIVAWPIAVIVMVLPFIRASARAETDLAAAYVESENLLLNILPKNIAQRLKTTTETIADEHEGVAILFVDIVGFTERSAKLQPREVLALLNAFFNDVDGLVEKHGLEKIKTIGDAYMIAGGLPEGSEDPEGKVACLALDVLAAVGRHRWSGTGEPLNVRIGINAGRVVAGVIGKRKFAYDLWGDAVNVAARMQETSLPGRIQLPDTLADRLRHRFLFEPRGQSHIEGVGILKTSFLISAIGRVPQLPAEQGRECSPQA